MEGKLEAWLGPRPQLGLHCVLGLGNGGIQPGDMCGKELQRILIYRTEAHIQLSI